MPSAKMPNPPGGELSCPVGTDPWIVVDRRSGEINAECKSGPPPSSSAKYKAWVRSNLSEDHLPRTLVEEEHFEKSLAQGMYVTEEKMFIFAKPMDTDEDEGIQLTM